LFHLDDSGFFGDSIPLDDGRGVKVEEAAERLWDGVHLEHCDEITSVRLVSGRSWTNSWTFVEMY